MGVYHMEALVCIPKIPEVRVLRLNRRSVRRSSRKRGLLGLTLNANPTEHRSVSIGRGGLRFGKDTRPGMVSNCFNTAICVQNFNDSLSCAIRITYRSSQRSSSIYEPRDPPLKVVGFLFFDLEIRVWRLINMKKGLLVDMFCFEWFKEDQGKPVTKLSIDSR